MAKSPSDDIPHKSVQDGPNKATGATCPLDNTLVTCTGARDDKELYGVCPVCKSVVAADPSLVFQVGTIHDESRAQQIAQNEQLAKEQPDDGRPNSGQQEGPAEDQAVVGQSDGERAQGGSSDGGPDAQPGRYLFGNDTPGGLSGR